MCVCDITDALRIPQPLVSHHLAVLRRAQMVVCRRQGQWVYYSLDARSAQLLERGFTALFHPASAGAASFADWSQCDDAAVCETVECATALETSPHRMRDHGARVRCE
jgi:hypothetical protein